MPLTDSPIFLTFFLEKKGKKIFLKRHDNEEGTRAENRKRRGEGENQLFGKAHIN